jgi:hypothetical protein
MRNVTRVPIYGAYCHPHALIRYTLIVDETSFSETLVPVCVYTHTNAHSVISKKM